MTRIAYRDAPIGRKLMIIGLLGTGVTLLVLTVVLIVRGALDWRQRTIADLETFAVMIGANAAPAVMFDDPKAAAVTLEALAAKPSILYGAIYDRNGKLFAEFHSPGGEAAARLAPIADGHQFSAMSVSLARRIVFKGDDLGTILLQSGLREMYGNLARDAGLILLTALVAFTAGIALLLRLQKAIVEPIRGLASAMQGVSDRQNYEVRVPVAGRDEVGVLSQTFNVMLEHIQNRDLELAGHRERLEAEVARRTGELQEANTRLEQELAERGRAEAALKRYTQQIDLLSQAAAMLQTCRAPEEVGGVMSPFLTKLFPGWSGGIYLLKSSKNMVEATATWGDMPSQQPVFAPNECWAIRRGQLHVADLTSISPRCAHASGPAACQVCAPMMAQGELLGVLHGQTADGGSPSEYGLFVRIAGETAQALANLRYREVLKSMAIRDPLTGLFNRRYLEEYLEMEISRATRKGTQLGLVVIDIDRFKQYNDTAGHEAGDEVLREVGQLMTRHIRDGDAACRYGGEEFIIAMWECSLEVAHQRAERLREDVKGLKLRLAGRSLATVTLSAGVAVFPDHGTTAEAVIRAADRALYTAKTSGRDRVCVATPA
jgi:diguanylate cyclase (GGDEF)-like protein